jgi:secondary thiamine-phosphate synthase enzyme
VNVSSHTIICQSTGRSMVDITPGVIDAVVEAGIAEGLANIFVHHTSASLLIGENADSEVLRDLERFFARLVPDGDPIFRHTAEGPDDMPAHVRSALTATTLQIPIREGRCDLGTWQGVFLLEHRQMPHRRRITVTVMGRI